MRYHLMIAALLRWLDKITDYLFTYTLDKRAKTHELHAKYLHNYKVNGKAYRRKRREQKKAELAAQQSAEFDERVFMNPKSITYRTLAHLYKLDGVGGQGKTYKDIAAVTGMHHDSPRRALMILEAMRLVECVGTADPKSHLKLWTVTHEGKEKLGL